MTTELPSPTDPEGAAMTSSRGEEARLASATYVVEFTHPRSASDAVSTMLGAYSEDDAADRVRDSMPTYDVTILRVAMLGTPDPVTCTYKGGEGAIYPEGPRVFMDWLDKWAPVLACDVHGHPAHPVVYESDDPAGPYSGPCQFHPEPRFRPEEEES